MYLYTGNDEIDSWSENNVFKKNMEEKDLIVQIITRCSSGTVNITPELYADIESLVKEYASKYLGKLGGSVKSKKKAKSSRINGKKGGRPKNDDA